MLMHSDHRNWRSFLLRSLVEEVVQSLELSSNHPPIDILVDIPTDLPIRGDRALLRRAIENLMLSAVAAMPRGGTLVATSAAVDGEIELEIADTGPSLSDQARSHVFDPCGNGERGTGWAMALVRHVAELHHGSVFAANCPEGGVALTLRLPCHELREAAA